MIADIWSIAENMEFVKPPPQRTLFLVGERKAGKSSIIQSFLLQTTEEAPKATVALEYRFARSTSDGIAHIYELGGGRLLANLINFPVNSETINDLVIVIALDLSSPYKVLDSLLYWLNVLTTRFEEVNGQSPNKKGGKRKKSNLKILVVGCKYDIFANQESENRKWMGRVLRYFCLKNKASLFYNSSHESRLTGAIRQTFLSTCSEKMRGFMTKKTMRRPYRFLKESILLNKLGRRQAAKMWKVLKMNGKKPL